MPRVRPNQADRAWRRRADINSLGLAVLLLLIALLYADAQSTSKDIQANRVEVFREQCKAQNAHHDNTILRLDEQIAKLPGDRRGEAEARRTGTVALIKALVPKRDCRAVVAQIREADD
jgi:hypothetical protein